MSHHERHSDPPPYLDTPWRTVCDFRPRSMYKRQLVFLAIFATIVAPIWLLYRGQSAAAEPDDHPVTPHWNRPSSAHAPAYTPVEYEDVAKRPARPHKGIVSPPASAPATDALAPIPDPPTFSLIMFSADSAAEGAILMKSIILYSSGPVHFHIICDEDAHLYLEQRLALIKRPKYDLLVRFYRLSYADMTRRLEREGAINTDHSAGVPGLMKLFIHEILPDTVKRAVFVDTDAFFISDPALLWQQFDKFGPTTAVSMPSHPDQSSVDWHDANKICSCIMLLDLERLRRLHLMDSSVYRAHGVLALAPATFTAAFGPPGADGHYVDVKLGDQGYWWAIVHHRPDVFRHLPYDWEVSSCLLDMYYTGLGRDDATEDDERRSQVHTDDTPQEGQAVLPKMLHFNCLDGTPHYYEWEGWSNPEDSLTMRWKPAVDYHVGYKWLWLNQAQTDDTKTTLETVYDVKFADERYA